MKMVTAIKLGTKSLTVVTVKVDGRRAEIVRVGAAELETVDAVAIRAAIGKCGMTEPKAILVISRSQALFRNFELPDSTSEERVMMVRYQVEKEMPLPLDQIRYSFIKAGRADGKVRIQVVAVPREVLDPLVAAVEGAGVKVSGAYVSSFGLLALSPDEARSAVVEVSGCEAEILVADQGAIEFSRAAPLGEGPLAESLAGEIHRCLLSHAAKSPGKKIGKVVLAGEGEEALALAVAVQERLAREVIPVGPGDLRTASTAGLCAALLRGDPLPDLLHPPVAVRKFRLTRAHRVAGLAGLVLLMLVAWAQVAISDRRTELREKLEELKLLEPRAVQVAKLHQQTQLAHQWYRDREVWIGVLSSLRENMNTANLWIVNAGFEDPGVIRLQGKAKDDQHITGLVAALTKTGKFHDIVIDKINPNRAEKAEYKNDFSLTAHLTGYDPKKKK
jgi:hypothetical protein